MKIVKFSGLRPKGTMNPRRLWKAGDTACVEDNVIVFLLKEPGFSLVSQKPKKTGG
jgi:hypothetical protein